MLKKFDVLGGKSYCPHLPIPTKYINCTVIFKLIYPFPKTYRCLFSFKRMFSQPKKRIGVGYLFLSTHLSQAQQAHPCLIWGYSSFTAVEDFQIFSIVNIVNSRYQYLFLYAEDLPNNNIGISVEHLAHVRHCSKCFICSTHVIVTILLEVDAIVLSSPFYHKKVKKLLLNTAVKQPRFRPKH